MALSVKHDTDVNTGTKNHIIPLNNHLNIRNAMVSLMVALSLCDRKHVIAIYMPKTSMSLKYHINHICQLVCVHI